MTVTVTRLNPTLPLDTPKGSGLAHFYLWLNEEHHALWVVCMDETGEWWTFENPDVRGTTSLTYGRVCDNKYLREGYRHWKDITKDNKTSEVNNNTCNNTSDTVKPKNNITTISILGRLFRKKYTQILLKNGNPLLVNNNEDVYDISTIAVKNLYFGEDRISFRATFNGLEQLITIPFSEIKDIIDGGE